MLQQFIQRRVRPMLDRPYAAEPKRADDVSARWRPADWLLGGSLATLAVVFVAGLLGLRSSTIELQDQSRSTTRDIAALKADTAERINGIAGDLAKTNQTLTDLIALRSSEAAAKGKAAGGGKEGDAATGDRSLAETKSREAKPPAERAGPKPAAKADAVRLGAITVRRQPERARQPVVRRPEPPPRPVARTEARGAAEALRQKREAILRQLRLRRLAGRGSGAQPL